ncbi:hypothetical protein CPC08DRAFT_771069 [Agrocybe pediades]|nr:hypothetical protein CPC08DRAFT_771069 [Agrocybe pediades]
MPPTRNGTRKKAVQKAPTSQSAEVYQETDMEDNADPVVKPLKKPVGRPKRQRSSTTVDKPVTEDQPPPKKARGRPKAAASANPATEPVNVGISPVPKRKRRTKEEMLADAAKAEEEMRRKEELARDTLHRMQQMNARDSARRTTEAQQIIRTYDQQRDLERSDAEEFPGYNDVRGSSAELEGGDGATEVLSSDDENILTEEKDKFLDKRKRLLYQFTQFGSNT